MVVWTLTSCEKNVIKGEGPIETRERTESLKSSFRFIKVDGEIELYVEYGKERKLEIRGYQNLLPIFKTEVVGDKLVLKYEDSYRIRNNNIKVYLTIDALPDLEINGSCKASFLGRFPRKEHLHTEINGSGRITYQGGEVNSCYFSVNGSGNIEAEQLSADKMGIKISGSGELKVSVKNELDVNISGSGKVFYKGTPVISQRISGSGKIISL